MRCIPPKVPFMDFPLEPDLDKLSATFAVIGASYGIPYLPAQFHCSSADAPDRIRERSFRYEGQVNNYDFDLKGTLFGDTGATLVDCGNIPATLDVQSNARAVTASVQKLLERGAIPLVLGGDDSIPALCVRAYEKHGQLNFLHFDAHLDFRDEVNGEKHGYSSGTRRIREMPWVNRIVQVGLRGSGSARPSDVQEALQSGNIIISAEDIHDHGISVVTDHLINDAPWFVSFDVDVMDPALAPGALAVMPGGMTFHQARGIFTHLCSKAQFAGMDFVEYAPSLDVRELTALTIVRLLTNIIGTTARAVRS